MSRGNDTQMWGSSSANFAHTWNVQAPGSFVITEDSGSSDLFVAASKVRGLKDTTYRATFNSAESKIEVVFELTADGINGSDRELAYTQPIDSTSALTATSPTEGRYTSSWGSDVDEFDGTWDFSGGGEIVIRHGGMIQCTSVPGIKDGLYQGTFDSSTKTLSIIFALVDDGYVNNVSSNPQEMLFFYPEVVLTPGTGIPVESEVFEEVASGGN